MDVIRDAINNVSLYEVKAAVRKAQNVVMNYTEMEAKVREATNNEPWGASSTLMNEIASGTYNYQLLNEIMPMIYKRFTEKSAEEWRQIYKALQLLEFLIKNGAEQVIDDARSHLSTIKMLRQFYFIDQAGKDQGVNVRNRAKELADLLSDVDKIRAERKKARQTKSKYIGVEGGGAGGFSTNMGGMSSNRNSGSRFGGFGSESADFGGYNGGGGVYGDGGGFSGRATGGFQDEGGSTSRSDSRGAQKFDEYDEYDDGGTTSSRRAAPPPPPRRQEAAAVKPSPPPPKKKQPAPEVDLLGSDDAFAPAPSGRVAAAPPLQAATSSAAADFDDFDDFQSAAPPKTQSMPAIPSMPSFSTPMPPPLTSSASSLSIVHPKPVSSNDRSDMRTLTGFTSPPISTTPSAFGTPAITPSTTGSGIGNMGMVGGMTAMKPSNTGFQPAAPNYFTSVPVAANTPGSPLSPSTTTQPKKASGDAFGSIWNQASVGIKKSATPTAKTPSLQTMAKEKATAGIWGTGPAAGSTAAGNKPPANSGGNGLEDLLG
ncbi:hypothetical protein BZA05DRAFT_477438 [Tricharina praecox]|uniref:uncharacterized protein n=1 Tax=Tricharina praecox TaxID=43433 RepID=UPI002220EC19|nr:uncharacterized protein BZA05DRAFT_477438 [Tricharina praecox]KAI5842791.1 hypothetical protein BZA05DRAFT_477438 [Tricharina praecox]